jgi:cobyrinic acid a,c-diamide synthase
MRALARRGLRVGAAKCGPDYIDPAFHAVATGHASLNLDSWTMEPGMVARLAALASAKADIVIAEGAMGLFDGVPNPPGCTGASADIAAATEWPVVLVHDVSGQGQTAAAIVRGVATHDPRVKLAGVVLNKVGSERHRRLAAEAIEAVGLPVFGALPREADIALPERHLGLVQAGETAELEKILDALADRVERHVDLDALCARAGGRDLGGVVQGAFGVKPPGQRIAVARDEAFSFFYPHLALGWRAAGAELAFFSPLNNEAPPQGCDICWLPGGYPELHTGRIAGATGFLNGLRRFAQDGTVHGECGGYMTLGRILVDAEGRSHVMAGLLNLETSFLRRKLNLGYRKATLLTDHCLGSTGSQLHGHEFHYATILREEGSPFALLCDAYSEEAQPAGLHEGRVSGSFFHAIA